jgi:predicted DNA-binding protein with PD1-like motif
MRWSGHAAYLGKLRNEHEILVRMPKGKRWVDILKTHFNQNWIHMAQDNIQW